MRWITSRLRQTTPAETRWAFTLIELLVVVAIISLLMSIMLPSMSRARQQAKSTVCLTRLSEFMKALVQYSSDNQYLLPPLQYATRDPNGPPYHGWAECLYVYLYRDQDFSREENYPVQRNRDGRFELWTCKEALPLANSTGHYRAYEVSWRKLSLDHIKPRLPLITDANPQVRDPNDLLVSYIPQEHVAGLQDEAYIDERHYGGANYCFSDGHAIRSTNLKQQLAEDWDLDPNTPNQ